MTTAHDEFLELAAAAIDFELSRDERAALEHHLADCSACRHRVAGFAADQTAIARLPRYVLGPATATAVRGRIARRSSTPRPTLRLLAAAAMLALLALAALAVGAQMIRRDDDLTEVTPTIAPSPGTPALPPGVLAAGSTVDVIVSGLRVRTAPTVDDSKSAKLEPLLSRGVQLQILEGPVNADDYDWYLVQAIGWPHRGWVAAADHDDVVGKHLIQHDAGQDLGAQDVGGVGIDEYDLGALAGFDRVGRTDPGLDRGGLAVHGNLSTQTVDGAISRKLARRFAQNIGQRSRLRQGCECARSQKLHQQAAARLIWIT
jgi:hypothetical protein